MKFFKVILVSFFLFQSVYSQKNIQAEFAAIDKKALQIPEDQTKSTQQIASYISSNFSSDKDKARAVFVWVASNISYDIENMYSVNIHDNDQDKMAKSLQTRKGICENYANLFTDICNKAGIKSFVIAGYTKQNIQIDLLSHAWSAALIDGKWFLFDPTWGSGYVSNGKFTKKLNDKFFRVNPEVSIKTHMPFDFLWQFLEYPITNQEFYDGKIQQNKAKSKFNFKEELAVWETQTELQQVKSAAARVEKNGVLNSLIFDQLKYLKLQAENIQQNDIANRYNAAAASYNDGILGYNDFINYRNRQFKPQLQDQAIQEMIDNAEINLEKAKTILREMPEANLSTTNMIKQLRKALDDASANVAEQKTWLETYFSKGKMIRKTMFFERKATLFGIPLN